MTETATIETERTKEMSQGGKEQQKEAVRSLITFFLLLDDPVCREFAKGMGSLIQAKNSGYSWDEPTTAGEDHIKGVISKLRNFSQLLCDLLATSGNDIPDELLILMDADSVHPRIDRFIRAWMKNNSVRAEARKVTKELKKK